jgi:hypothetical protein
MKTILIYSYFSLKLLFLLVYFSSLTHAQKFNLELSLGGSLSQISGDGTSGFRQFGSNLGAYLYYDWKEDWKLNTGLVFNQKGARKFMTADNITTYKLRTNYIDLPFELNYHFKSFRFSAGPSINFLVNYTESTNFGEINTDRIFRRIEFSINSGVGYQFKENWIIGLHYQNSILPVRDHVAGYSIMPPTNSYLVELFYNLYNLGQYHSLFLLQVRYQI